MSFVDRYLLVVGRQYTVRTQLGNIKCTIKGTFDRYERNKLMFKDEYVLSIVFTDWITQGDTPDGKPCPINPDDLYFDLIEDLKFFEVTV